jgi:transcriptional regulator of acetoin/glycerol metabolism
VIRQLLQQTCDLAVENGVTEKTLREMLQKTYVRTALDKHSGKVTATAKWMGVNRVYLHRVMKKWRIVAEEFK